MKPKALMLLGSLGTLSVAWGSSLSSLTVGESIDNHEQPAVRYADTETVAVTYAGAWFPSGVCALYVDGVLVGTSSGVDQMVLLPGDSSGWRTYRVSLVAKEGVSTKFVTVFPSVGHKCSKHDLVTGKSFLEAKSAGTVHRVKVDETVPVTWSGFWNESADQSVVKLYKGGTATGEPLDVLAECEVRDEGIVPFCPSAIGLDLGLYTLTHFDGVETLTAQINVRGGGLLLLVR